MITALFLDCKPLTVRTEVTNPSADSDQAFRNLCRIQQLRLKLGGSFKWSWRTPRPAREEDPAAEPPPTVKVSPDPNTTPGVYP